MSHEISMSLSSLLSLTTSILAFSGLLSICHVLIPMEFPIFFILHREHKHAWKGEYLGSEVFLFWTYARCWLGVILLKICSNFKILCLVSDRTWWHQVQVSVVVCPLHAYDKTVSGPNHLSVFYDEIHQVNATRKRRSKILTQTPHYMDCLPACFASPKSTFYLAKLLIVFNSVSKEESVSNASSVCATINVTAANVRQSVACPLSMESAAQALLS